LEGVRGIRLLGVQREIRSIDLVLWGLSGHHNYGFNVVGGGPDQLDSEIFERRVDILGTRRAGSEIQSSLTGHLWAVLGEDTPSILSENRVAYLDSSFFRRRNDVQGLPTSNPQSLGLYYCVLRLFPNNPSGVNSDPQPTGLVDQMLPSPTTTPLY